MRELDELRIEIVRAVENGEDFSTLQKAFIRKKNSLKRNGHSRWKEGYDLQEVYEDSCKIEVYIPGETPYMMVNKLVFRFPQDSEVQT